MLISLHHPLGAWCDTNFLLLIQIKCSKCQQAKPTRLLNTLTGNRFVCEETIKGGWLVVMSIINLRQPTVGDPIVRKVIRH